MVGTPVLVAGEERHTQTAAITLKLLPPVFRGDEADDSVSEDTIGACSLLLPAIVAFRWAFRSRSQHRTRGTHSQREEGEDLRDSLFYSYTRPSLSSRSSFT